MGGIWMARESFVSSFVEIVGFKAGLVLTAEKLAEHLGSHDPDLAKRLLDPEVGGFRMESTGYEDAVAHLLHQVGVLDTPVAGMPVADVFHKFRGDPERDPLIEPVGELFVEALKMGSIYGMVRLPTPDLSPFIKRAGELYGPLGTDVAAEYERGVARYLVRSPWLQTRHIDWKDERELADLFKSEKLESMHGQFFDQRFIDYLAKNFEDEIDDIHWRQFEGMAAEHFGREGFRVELGPGRNDDGVDLRVFPAKADPTLPPMIIVQCKRERRKIGKSLVKAVWADTVHEKADSGLIVTTSSLSPGAETLRTARAYPVDAIDRPKLRAWIEAMKSEPI
jgi:restriction system protein